MPYPYVIINCAISVDGKLALPTRVQTRISCEEDLLRVHRLRNECDAILVGINTVLADDPSLVVNSRYVADARTPIRVVLDATCKIPATAKILDMQAPTYVFTLHKYVRAVEGAEVIGCSGNETKGELNLSDVLQILYKYGVKKLLVEGGGSVIWSFLNERLADELRVYIGSIIIGGKQSPTLADGNGIQKFEDRIKLKLKEVVKVGSGVLLQYEVIR
jgi:2,5-diamino-6-(ribosylamino)-4(3H)-pyrimidinone 5'-phosphate reductase